MSSRIEIELTSKREDTQWTWRAAGAKQPKGVLENSVLYEDAQVGDVVRAEAEFEIDGITILSVLPPQGRRKDSANRLEILGSGRKFEPVTSQLAGKQGRGRRSENSDYKESDRAGRGERATRPDRGDRSSRPTRERKPGSADSHSGSRADADRRPEQRSRAGGQPDRAGAAKRGQNRNERAARPQRPERSTFKRLVPKDDYRKAVLESLPAEQRPIAERLQRGGIPSVRQAIDTENAKAKAEGRPAINSSALVAVAEEILPRLKAAEWMDKAEAAKVDVDEISIRDLRTVVAGADAVARTDEARVLASELREALERRTNRDRENWFKEIDQCLSDGRLLRALRLSARPPDAHAKFTAELLDRLKSAAEDAMSPETAPDRWVILIDAVANSPVRRSVEPKGLPSEPGEELTSAAKQAAGRIPALAKQLGVSMPPPPPPPSKRPVDTAQSGS